MLAMLYILGALIALVGWVIVVIAAFSEGGLIWGLLSLFIPIVCLVFVITHWDDAWKGFLVWVAGVGMMVTAIVMGFGQTAGA